MVPRDPAGGQQVGVRCVDADARTPEEAGQVVADHGGWAAAVSDTAGRCSNPMCNAKRCVMIVLRSPRGEYQLCSECYLPGKPAVKIERKKGKK